MSFDGFLGGFPDEDEEEPLYFEKLLLPYRVEKLTVEKDLGVVLTGSGSRPIVVVMEGPAAVYSLYHISISQVSVLWDNVRKLDDLLKNRSMEC